MRLCADWPRDWNVMDLDHMRDQVFGMQHMVGLRQQQKPRNLLGRTMVKLYQREMFLHAMMLLVEIGVR